MKCHAIFGPPGTGKTYELEGLVVDFAKSTANIAVLSFTKAAASVLTSRVKRENKIRFVGTNHSLCFSALKLTRQQVALSDTFIKWLDTVSNVDEQEVQWSLNVRQYAVRNGLSLADAYTTFASARMDCPFIMTEFVCESYELWKKDQCLVDFDDMLDKATGLVDPYDIVVVDEAQDLSKQQWRFIESLVDPKGRLVVAGDDDQSIFTWAGAYVHGMRDICDTQEVLSKSHRIPASVHGLAERTIAQVANRVLKKYEPRGEVGYVDILSEYNTDAHYRTYGCHTVLCRDRFNLRRIEEDIIAQGVPYLVDSSQSTGYFTGLTAKLIRAIRNCDLGTLGKYIGRFDPISQEEIRSNKVPSAPWTDALRLEGVPEEEISYLELVDIDAEPQVVLSTIHNFKGKEDDHIVLIADTTELVEAAVDVPVAYDDEIRVWYVGITRAKVGLTIVGINSFIPV